LNLNLKFDLNQLAKAFSAHLANRPNQPTRARLSRPARVWVEPPTQPSPSLAHLLLSSLPLATGSPPPPPGRSGQPWRPSPPPPRANHSPQRPLPSPPNRFVGRLLSEEIYGWISLRESPSADADLTSRRTSSLGMMCVLVVVQVCVCTPVEASVVVLPVAPR
jgi:hypothetical protein